MKYNLSETGNFYDRYHQKNNRFRGIISENNFTYFYIQQVLRHPYVFKAIHGKVLDVGCGVGTLILYLSNWAKMAVGIDVSDRAIKIANEAKNGIGIKNTKFVHGLLKGPIGQFDLIMCTEVIEHVEDDQKFASILYSNLAQGGILVLTTPSNQSWLYKKGFYKEFDEEVGHIRRYNQESLEKVLESAGFKILFIRSVEGPLRNILFTTKLGFLIKFIKGPLIPVFHFFDMISVKLLGACDIQVIAKKD